MILSGIAISAMLLSCSNCQKEDEKCVGHGKVIANATEALAELKAGNQRFVENKMSHKDYKARIEETKEHQAPHSLILSCMDSRVPPEIIFDQNIGDIFVARVAGNVEDSAIVASMEYAVKVKGTKLLVVMGHTNCGAVTGIVENVHLGHLTGLLNEIKPVLDTTGATKEEKVQRTSENNVKKTINDILAESPIIKEMVDKGEVKIVGAMYDLSKGTVTFNE